MSSEDRTNQQATQNAQSSPPPAETAQPKLKLPNKVKPEDLDHLGNAAMSMELALDVFIRANAMYAARFTAQLIADMFPENPNAPSTAITAEQFHNSFPLYSSNRNACLYWLAAYEVLALGGYDEKHKLIGCAGRYAAFHGHIWDEVKKEYYEKHAFCEYDGIPHHAELVTSDDRSEDLELDLSELGTEDEEEISYQVLKEAGWDTGDDEEIEGDEDSGEEGGDEDGDEGADARDEESAMNEH